MSRRESNRKPGFVLIFVLLAITLATALAVLAASSSTQLARTTRSEHESIMLRQLNYSAHAWIRESHDHLKELPLVMPAGDLLPEGATGTVTVTRHETRPDLLVYTAKIAMGGGREIRGTTKLTRP